MLFSCLFQCFEEKEYQTESKRNETFRSDLFGTNTIQGTWSGRQAMNEAATRVPGAPPIGGCATHPRASTDLLLPPIYTYVPPNDQIWSQNPNSTAATFCTHEIPSWGLFRSSAGRGRHHGGPLHHHSLSDEV